MTLLNRRFFQTSMIGLAGVIVALVYGMLSFASIEDGRVKLNSPDETANYFFARTFAQTGVIGYYEPLLLPSKGVVHPRSMTTAGEHVVPVGFLGLAVLYGMLGKGVGAQAMLFFTPFLAVLSAGLFYYFLTFVFSKRVAALSAVLLLIHPAYWYYASRGMLPNVLFVDLLLAGVLVLCIASRNRRALPLYCAGGLLIGCALTVRLSEIIWVAGSLCVAGATLLGRRFFKAAIITAIGMALPLTGLFLLNTSVYGHPFIFGYQSAATYESAASFDRVVALFRACDLSRFSEMKSELGLMFSQLQGYAFPFGFHPPTFQKHFQEYGIAMFWWFTLPTAFGLLLILKRGLIELVTARKKTLLVYTLLSLGIGYWLVAFYGSWVFYDNISEEVTIGNSYVRYWLPLYIVGIPFAASLFVWLVGGSHAARLPRTLIVCAAIIVMMFFSGKAVLLEYRDSLFPVAQNIESYHRSAEWIGQHTEPNAVIFSERSDKNFFPERRVAQSFPNLAERELLPPLVQRVPVYYYSMWTPADADYVSRRYLTEYKLRLDFVAPFHNGERLYKVVTVD